MQENAHAEPDKYFSVCGIPKFVVAVFGQKVYTIRFCILINAVRAYLPRRRRRRCLEIPRQLVELSCLYARIHWQTDRQADRQTGQIA